MKNPMLAAKIEDLSKLNLTYPVIVQPKYDGIRCLLDTDGVAYSRTLKLIPNKYIQQMLREYALAFGVLWPLDGELWYEGYDYNKIQSIVMSETHPDSDNIVYVIYDAQIPNTPFKLRQSMITHSVFTTSTVELTSYHWCADATDLSESEADYIGGGYEGIIIRDPNGFYKHGRSTLREGALLKYKRCDDAEAEVLELIELQHNLNRATTDERGYTKRSSHGANKIPSGMVGSLKVRGINGRYKGKVFCVSCGSLTQEERLKLFADDSIIGQTITYTFAATRGTDDAPAEPRVKGIRIV